MKSLRITLQPATAVVAFIAILQLILQFSLLTRGVAYLTASLTIDDTYYYLQTAWNTKQLGFVTFDGLHPTNGVQLLWFVLVLALAWLSQTKTALLLATLALSFLLNASSYFFILKIGAAARQPALGVCLAGLWSLQCLPFRVYSMGMENSLHAPVIWCAIWQCLVFAVRVRNNETPSLWGLTGILILNAWTRLDSALLSAIMYSFCLHMLIRSLRYNFALLWYRYRRSIVGSSVLGLAGLVIQLGAFRLIGDSFLPVSALIKTSGAPRGVGEHALNKLAEVFVLGMPSILQGRLPLIALIIVGATGILIVLGAQYARYFRGPEPAALLTLWTCLLVGEVAYHLYVAVSGVEYRQYFVWYRSPSFIFWSMTAGIIGLLAVSLIRSSHIPAALLRWGPAAASLLLFAVAITVFVRSVNFVSELYAERYQAALWIGEHYAPTTVFAAWNAGQLGYFSDRTFINLDGVINSFDYYDRVLKGNVALTDYLADNDVAYVVDYATYASLPAYAVVGTFPLDDGTGRTINIWAVSPQVTILP